METSNTPGRRGGWIAAVAVTVLTAVLPYVGTLTYPFLHDDQWAVLNNPVVTGDVNLVRILTTNAWGNEPEHLNIPNYRPLSVLTLALTRAVSGLDPVPYRITNLALHALVALLWLAVLARLGVRPATATLATAWFALHPVHAETVLFVVNREEMLCAASWSSALFLAVGRSGLVPASRRETWTPRSLAGLAALTALAVLSKEGGATIPFLVLCVGLCWPGPGGRLRSLAPPALVSGVIVMAYLGWRLHVLGHLGAGAIPWQDNPLVRLEAPERWVGGLAVAYEAFRLLIAPVDPSVDYGFNALGIPGPGTGIRAVGGMMVLALLGVLAVVSARRHHPLSALGVVAMAVAWAPVSHVAFPSSILLADRLLLLPSAGMAMVLSGLLSSPSLDSRPRTRRAAAAIGIAWTLAFAGLIADRAGDFHDARTLFASSLRNRPGSTRLHNNLGLALLRDGRSTEAEAHFRQALAIDPTNAEAHNNLGLLLAGIGRPGSAAEEFRLAIAIRPDLRSAWHNLCLLMTRLGRAEEAMPVCDRARALGVPVEEAPRQRP